MPRFSTNSICSLSIEKSAESKEGEIIDLGVEMINDIFALRKSGSIEAVANSNVILSLMHMQGTPQDMQNNPSYIDVVDEVIEFLKSRVSSCEESGIDRSRIVIDPGFGFGKTHEKVYTELSTDHPIDLTHQTVNLTQLIRWILTHQKHGARERFDTPEC